MAKSSMALTEPAEKGPSDDVVGRLFAHVVNRLNSRIASDRISLDPLHERFARDSAVPLDSGF